MIYSTISSYMLGGREVLAELQQEYRVNRQYGYLLTSYCVFWIVNFVVSASFALRDFVDANRRRIEKTRRLAKGE
jgi:hypothetical protein